MSNGRSETLILKSWHLRLAVLASIVVPTVTATGAFYGVKNSIVSDKAELIHRVDKLELEAAKTYADKTALQNLDTRTQKMENDITEIKTILKNKL